MTNLEIARVFNEEKGFRQNILNNLANSDGWICLGYCIFAEDHEPFTEEQQKVWNEYGDGGILELHVDIDIDELLG